MPTNTIWFLTRGYACLICGKGHGDPIKAKDCHHMGYRLADFPMPEYPQVEAADYQGPRSN